MIQVHEITPSPPPPWFPPKPSSILNQAGPAQAGLLRHWICWMDFGYATSWKNM